MEKEKTIYTTYVNENKKKIQNLNSQITDAKNSILESNESIISGKNIENELFEAKKSNEKLKSEITEAENMIDKKNSMFDKDYLKMKETLNDLSIKYDNYIQKIASKEHDIHEKLTLKPSDTDLKNESIIAWVRWLFGLVYRIKSSQ